MALGAATKQEIKLAIKEAFEGMEIPSPEGCVIERERMRLFEETLKEHEKFINGNGHDGAKLVMEKFKNQVEVSLEKINGRLVTLETFMGDVRGLLKWLITLVVGTIILALM